MAMDMLGEPGHVLSAVYLRSGARTRLASSRSGGWTSTLMSLVALSVGMVMMALYHLRRAMHLTAMRSQFVTSVSHELRTPLAQIRMFAETLGYGRARSDEERNRFIAILHREAVRLSELVENVLQFARLDQRIDGLRQRIDGLHNRMTDGFSRLERKFDQFIDTPSRPTSARRRPARPSKRRR
jgi:signal transduction histidine kinase